MFVQEWHLIQPMLPLPVCHHCNMGTRGVRSKYSEQCQMGCSRGCETMPACCFHAFSIAAIVTQPPTTFVVCAAASIVNFIVDAAADTIESVVSCVTMTFLHKKQHLCDHAEQGGRPSLGASYWTQNDKLPLTSLSCWFSAAVRGVLAGVGDAVP